MTPRDREDPDTDMIVLGSSDALMERCEIQVQNLGDPLTSTSDNVRSRATLLLAQVTSQLQSSAAVGSCLYSL